MIDILIEGRGGSRILEVGGGGGGRRNFLQKGGGNHVLGSNLYCK